MKTAMTLEQVVEQINGLYGASAERQAANYALSNLDDDSSIEYNLDCLLDAGAQFNFATAMAMAMEDVKNG